MLSISGFKYLVCDHNFLFLIASVVATSIHIFLTHSKRFCQMHQEMCQNIMHIKMNIRDQTLSKSFDMFFSIYV